MKELVKLEKAQQEFTKRKVALVVVSLESPEMARLTQADFLHLKVVADGERKLSEALQLIHAKSAPDGGDTSAPTTFIVDGKGLVRWTYRPPTVFSRLTPEELLAAIEQHAQ
jgi:peroxiredoxin